MPARRSNSFAMRTSSSGSPPTTAGNPLCTSSRRSQRVSHASIPTPKPSFSSPTGVPRTTRARLQTSFRSPPTISGRSSQSTGACRGKGRACGPPSRWRISSGPGPWRSSTPTLSPSSPSGSATSSTPSSRGTTSSPRSTGATSSTAPSPTRSPTT